LNGLSGGLLARELEGEFAVADAPGKTFRIFRGGFFTIGGNEFGEGGKEAALRKAIAVDTIQAGFGPGFLQISERNPLLLMIRYRIPSSVRAR
jgi:hypothetical protein